MRRYAYLQGVITAADECPDDVWQQACQELRWRRDWLASITVEPSPRMRVVLVNADDNNWHPEGGSTMSRQYEEDAWRYERDE